MIAKVRRRWISSCKVTGSGSGWAVWRLKENGTPEGAVHDSRSAGVQPA